MKNLSTNVLYIVVTVIYVIIINIKVEFGNGRDMLKGRSLDCCENNEVDIVVCYFLYCRRC